MNKTYKIDSKKYKAILFDWDGTLVKSEEHQHKAFQKVFQEIGHEYPDFENHLNKNAGRGIMGSYSDITGGVVNEKTISKIRQKRRNYYLELLKDEGLETVPGAVSLLNQIHETGIVHAIATGSSKATLDLVLPLTDLPINFDLIVTSDDYNNLKPEPDCFLLAARILGVNREDCLVFEDSFNGIKAAKSAEMDYIAVATYLSEDELLKFDPNAKVIKDFTEVEIE